MFGTLKRSYGYQRVRYLGKPNALEMWFKLMAYNLRKADKFSMGPSTTASSQWADRPLIGRLGERTVRLIGE